jgi:hypothetical protein
MKTSLIISWLGNSGPGIERYFPNYTNLMATAMMTCPYWDLYREFPPVFEKKFL